MAISRLLTARKEKLDLHESRGEKIRIILRGFDHNCKPILVQSAVFHKRDNWETCKCKVYLMEQKHDI